MNKTKHFKRTAFNLSAKSMVSTLLLLIAMLMPQGAWATDFISEVKYGVNDNQNTAKGYLSGYTIIDHDFNNGTSGDWVYIGYKTSTNAADAITGLLVVTNDTESNSSTYGDSGFKAGGAKTMMVDGKRYYLAECGGNADMNHSNKTHKNPVYLYYTKDGNTTNGAQLITTLGAHRGELTANPVGLNVVPLFGGNGSNTNGTYSLSKLSDFGDTNKGGGGSFNYITYTTHTHAYTAAFNWATNGKTCTATTNCAGCGDTHSNLACTVTDAPKSGAAATCTVMGWTTYTAKVTSNGKDFSATKDVQDIAALGHGSTGYNESYSWTGNAYNNASQDTKACIFTLTCKKCSTKVVNGTSLTCTKTAHVDATCTATGSTTYQATGSYTSSNSAYNYIATKTNVYTVAALGHGTTGYTESYSWTGNAYNNPSQDTKACTFTLTCKKCSTKVVNGALLTCTRTAHVDATCTATGSTTYQATGSYTAANSAYNYMATKTNVYTVAALGHGTTGYTESYSWTGNAYNDASQDTKACTFTLTCKKCSTKVVNGASLTCTKMAHVDASCTETGSTTYQATGSYTAANSAYNYSATKTNVYTVAALGHGSTGYTPTYTWGGTYDAATCSFTLKCNQCNTDVSTQNLTPTKVDANHVDVTCGKDGNERWTATGSYSKTGDAQYNGTAQVDDYAIPATGLHTFNEETDPHHTLCTVCGHSFFRYTSSTGKAVDPWDANALKDAYDAKLDFTNTYVDGQGVMEFNGTLKTIGNIAFSYCLDFIGDLTIPNSVTSIGSSAFQGCEGFTGALTIPNSVTSIEKQAFARCSNLTGNLTMPNSVTSIEKQAFALCSKLTGNLTIPNSVTSIGGEAFTSCSGFTGIEFQSVPQIGSDAFNKVNCPKTVVLSDDSYVYTGENPNFPTVASVNYNRYIINDGGMWSFIVPFDIPAAQAAQLGKFYQYRTHEGGKVYFDNIARVGEGIVRANTAYFFEPAKDITSITVENPTFDTTGNMADATNPSEPGLYGTYSQIDIPVGAYGYAMHDGQSTFAKAGTGNLLRSFRAYLWLGSGASMAKVLAFFGDYDVDAIEFIGADDLDLNAPIYNLQGQRITTPKKGEIYIQNGKKVMKK